MKSTYTKKQFLADVAKEAKALRRHATAEEREKLQLHFLCADDKRLCVYGQMTGDCSSDRAIELIEKCCPRYFKNIISEAGGLTSTNYSMVRHCVNGARLADGLASDREELLHLSSIETYIALPNAKNANLIAYLKGETIELKL